MALASPFIACPSFFAGAAEAAVVAGLGTLAPDGWIAHEYNERPYSERGWCSFEGSVSVELIARLSTYPKMEALLNRLPPKLLSLSAGRPAEPVAWEAHAGGRHVEHTPVRTVAGVHTGTVLVAYMNRSVYIEYGQSME